MALHRQRQRVFVLVPARPLLLDIAGPIEALRYANLLNDRVCFDVRYIGPLPDVTSSVGLRLGGIEPLPDRLEPGDILFLSGNAERPLETGHPIESVDAGVDKVVEWLRHCVGPGAKLVCICSGALLAARAGLLDGRNCTTHFDSIDLLRAAAPKATVLDGRIFVEDDGYYSSAGVTAGIDLTLHILAEEVGPAVAAAVARQMVVYFRRSGADPQLSPWLAGRNHIHPVVHRVQDAIIAEPERPWQLATLAPIAAASPRHLSRLFNLEAGMTLPEYLNSIRVTLAHQLLVETRLDIEQVAERVGFASSRQLRRAWARFRTTPPSAVRRDGAINQRWPAA